MKNIDEKNLLMRLYEGDREAINIVFMKYGDSLFSFIMRMVNDHSFAEDIFQETWLRVIKYGYTFRGNAKFTTWLFQISLNIIRDKKNKENKIKHVPLDTYEEILYDKSTNEKTDTEKSEVVKMIIDSLPVKQREVIILRYYHDLNEQEVSDIVGCPKGTVKSRLYNASVAIRGKWERYLKSDRCKNE